MKGIIRLSILCCFVLLTAVPAAQAQERGTIQAIATVVSGLRVTPMNNLNFETVLPGIRKTVDKTDTITIWIGGAVWPSISQTGGDYSGDIILIVAYTGA
jgi:hypothetical protein